ncbi:MAG: hypothetical protein PHV32_01850 [Eubacteriales bacterium]|nr:hypothetical protein [Eubacteriales bacterium]
MGGRCLSVAKNLCDCRPRKMQSDKLRGLGLPDLVAVSLVTLA